MTWSITNLVIQIVGGFLGAHATTTVTKEHGFGFLGNSLTGLIGGALSGFFLQSLAAPVALPIYVTGRVKRLPRLQ